MDNPKLHCNTLESSHGTVSLERVFSTGHRVLFFVATLLSPACDNQILIFYFCALYFFNTIFLLIICECHTMFPFTLISQSFQVQPLILWPPPKKKREKEEEEEKERRRKRRRREEKRGERGKRRKMKKKIIPSLQYQVQVQFVMPTCSLLHGHTPSAQPLKENWLLLRFHT